MKQTIRQFAMVALGLFMTVLMFAQVTTSSMSGKITDAKGGISGAAVIATHTASGTQYYSITDNSGNYRIMNILPGGPYSVKIQLMGYRTVETTGIYVALADNFVINQELQEETIGLEELIITAEAVNSNMKSDRAGAMTSVDARAIQNVPTVSRSVNDLLKMTPQAYVSGSYAYVGGGNYRQSFVTVDGAAFNNAFGIGTNLPANGSPISLDALEQVSISITPYDVRQSGFTGGSINAVTRSGSNEFSASAYTYFNNQNFVGTKVGDVEFEISNSQRLTYGARVGGPIIKDKLFFFLNVEFDDSVEPGPSRIASTSSNQYTDGSNNVARPSATVMDALRSYLLKTYDYETGEYQGYSSKSPGFKFLGRIDWNISKNHKFNIRYSNTQAKNPTAPSTSTSGLGNRNFTSNNRTAMTALYFQNARYYQEQNFSSLAAELNSRFFDGRLNNTLRASYSHQYEPRTVDGAEFPFVDIAVAGNIYTSFGTELFSYGNLRDVQTINITDEVSYSVGINNFLAGLQYEHNKTKNGFQRFGAGYYQFAFDSEEDLADAIANGTVFNDPQQFAITHSNNEDFSQAFPSFDYNQLSIYLQDELAISNRFKVTAGIRLELPMFPALTTYNEQVATTQLAVRANNNGYYNTTNFPTTKVMFSPRLGFNWDLTGNRKVVLRGGTGLFTGRIPFVWAVAQAGDSGVLQTTYAGVKGKGIVPTFTSDRMEMLSQIYGGSFTPGTTPSISSCSLVDPGLKMPQTWKTSLALDVKLPWGMTGTLEGVYNNDINPTQVVNVGVKSGVLSNIEGSKDNRMYYGSYYDSKLKNAYLLTNADKSGYYYSITAKLEKAFQNGFTAMVAYSHSASKVLGDGVGDQMYSAWNIPATVNGNNALDLSYASYVMPHRLIASVSYRKEYGKHFASAISMFYNGGPQGRFSYTYTSNVVGDGGGYNLIYVPRSRRELTFKDYTYKNVNGASVLYTAKEQANDFWSYIKQDDYLKTRKGQYAEMNGVVYPWTNSFDIKLTQDFFMNVKGKRHTLQLGLDILNVGNLLNSEWGNVYSYNKSSILKLTNTSAFKNNETPVYQYMVNGTEKLTETWRKSIGTGSTYSMQISLRYIFN